MRWQCLDEDIVLAVAAREPLTGINISVNGVTTTIPQKSGIDGWLDEEPTAPDRKRTHVDDLLHKFKIGYKRVCENLFLKEPYGMDCLMDSTIPAGLSADASAVVLGALTTLHIKGRKVVKSSLLTMAMAGEHTYEEYVKAPSNNRVQSITASDLHEVGLERLVCVIVDSRVPSANNSLIRSGGNLTVGPMLIRSIETRLGALLLSTLLGVSERRSYRLLQDNFVAKMKPKDFDYRGNEENVLEEFAAVAVSKLSECETNDVVRLEEVAASLKTPVSMLYKRYLGDLFSIPINELPADFLSKTLPNLPLCLSKRASHILSESQRLYTLRHLLRDEKNPETYASKLGALMNESHISLRDKMEVSCKSVDELVEVCGKAGALGSHITGEGFGGCVISIVQEAKLESFITSVKEEYHYKRFPELREKPTSSFIVAGRLSMGALMDDELAAIRARRLAELQAKGGRGPGSQFGSAGMSGIPGGQGQSSQEDAEKKA
ncbi:N-acetylgalactosamine kinase [Gonapodya sp. JEL0774]|nr:N-acetylgalactosamine kinase [Gonapodya sp. JEL0774]